MSHMKTEPGRAGRPQRTPPQRCPAGSPRRGPWVTPTQAASSPLGPPRSCTLKATQERRRSREMLGKWLNPLGPALAVDDRRVGLVPPAQARVRLCPGSARSPKPQGGGQQANEAGRTPPPGGVAVWWQGHLGCAGPLMESAGTCNKERVGVAQRGQLAAKPVGWRKRESRTRTLGKEGATGEQSRAGRARPAPVGLAGRA